MFITMKQFHDHVIGIKTLDVRYDTKVLVQLGRVHESHAWYAIDAERMSARRGDEDLILPGRIPAVLLFVRYMVVESIKTKGKFMTETSGFLYACNDKFYGYDNMPSLYPRESRSKLFSIYEGKSDLADVMTAQKRNYYRKAMASRLPR